MKNNKIIIYDDSCPLCSAYTKAFVSAGMIKKENRKNFTNIQPSLLNLLDTKRCPNEIPVIDAGTNEVFYGIDGLAEILESRIPFTKKIIGIRIIKWFLLKLYKLISYNRRVIVAVKQAPGNFDCTPDFNYRYRFAFMFIFLLFNSLMLFPVHEYILKNSLVIISSASLEKAHFILVGCNIIIACCLDKKMAFEYLGQVNMLALTTVMATIPIMILNISGLIQHVFINNIYLFLLTIFVIKEYRRRMSFAGIMDRYPVIYIINLLGICGFIVYLIN